MRPQLGDAEPTQHRLVADGARLVLERACAGQILDAESALQRGNRTSRGTSPTNPSASPSDPGTSEASVGPGVTVGAGKGTVGWPDPGGEVGVEPDGLAEAHPARANVIAMDRTRS